MHPVGIAVSGRIATGKTTIAHALASHLGWKYVGLGDYLRQQVIASNRLPSREILQELGSRQVKVNPRQFCENALQYFGWEPGMGVVIDGLRNMEVRSALLLILNPLPLFLIYCSAEDKVRNSRLDMREPGLHKRLAILEKHPIEQDVITTLPSFADLTIDTGRNSTEQSIQQVLKWLRSRENVDRSI